MWDYHLLSQAALADTLNPVNSDTLSTHYSMHHAEMHHSALDSSPANN